MPPLNSFQKSCIAVALGHSIAQPTYAAVINVNTTLDSSTDNTLCTLRDAIDSANTNTSPATSGCTAGDALSADTINLPTGTITLASALSQITSNVDIVGAGQTLTAIDGAGNHRILYFSNATVSISDVTLSNGSASAGGGIFSKSSTVAINNATLSGNNGDSAIGYGGGMYARSSTVTITNSTVADNTTGYYGGGVYSALGAITIANSTFSGNRSTNYDGGGLHVSNSVTTITNSTFSNNRSHSSGGGIHFRGNAAITISNSTLSGNSGDDGGGIYLDDGGVLTISNSIISGNTADTQHQEISVSPQLTIVTNNNVLGSGEIESSSAFSANFTPSNTDFVATSDGGNGNIPLSNILSPVLANNGEPTLTFSIPESSPAIDLGVNCPATDQRGEPRNSARCDAGAFERPDESNFFVIPLSEGKAVIFDL